MDDVRPVPISDLIGTVCLRCGRNLCRLTPLAAFCPGCGGRLRSPRTAWDAARGLTRYFRSPAPPEPDLPSPRAAMVVGYGNALWRLGWRYEHGRGLSRNVPEAIRCYRKSAGLGNVEAQTRLDVRAGEPVPVVSIDR